MTLQNTETTTRMTFGEHFIKVRILSNLDSSKGVKFEGVVKGSN